MSKIIKLTESDLTRLVKRVIKEQEQIELASQIVNSPKLNKLVDRALDMLSTKELNNLSSSLNSIGINSGTSPMTAIAIADDLVDSTFVNDSSEMTEDDEKLSVKDKIKNGVFGTLASIGFLNLALFGGPISYLIDTLYPQIADGFLDNQISIVLGVILAILGNQIKLKKTNK